MDHSLCNEKLENLIEENKKLKEEIEKLKKENDELLKKQVDKKEEVYDERRKNEAHVQQRRQSRVMIVKSKISSEIQRGSKKMIEYLEDSPFFWSNVGESENRVKRLSLRLNQLCDMILDLCSVTITFSQHCGRIHNLVTKSWEDVEKQYSSDIISLSSIFNELGEQFLHMSQASKQLAVTMKAVLVDAFRSFTQQHLAKVAASSKVLHILEKEYENALRKLLHSPHKNLPKINPKRDTMHNKKYNRITDLQQYEEWKKKTMDLRANYELYRYDHCNTLNAVINRHRYELILNLCACFSGFETFFHVGYEASLAHKVFHRSIQMGIAQKTINEDKNDKKLAKIRKEIESILFEGKDYYKEKKKEKLEKRKAAELILTNNAKAKDIDEDKDKKDGDDDEDDEDDEDIHRDTIYNVDYYSGYLWKQSSNMKKDWKRRWFVLENGELAYYRSKDKLEREFVVNTMLCKVKERMDHDYRYVFELISPSRRVYVLQAQSSEDYIAWCSIIKNQVHRLLRKNTSYMQVPKENNETIYNDKSEKRELKSLISGSNSKCADCGKNTPEWVSINTGVVICIDCCGIHRGLGTHISKVRSLILDDINKSVLSSILVLGGNDKINDILVNTIPSDYNTINSQSTNEEKEKYIKGKYMFKMFIDPNKNKEMSYQAINEKLYDGAVNNDLLNIFEALCYGAQIDYQFEHHLNRTALHETSLANFVEATEFLLQNGANQNIEDDDSFVARELAENAECNDVLAILEYHVGFDTLQYNKTKRKEQKSNLQSQSPSNNSNNSNNSINQSPPTDIVDSVSLSQK